MWLESTYHRDDEDAFLPEMPRVEKVCRIICWIISGVTRAAVEEDDDCEGMNDDEAEANDAVLEDGVVAW